MRDPNDSGDSRFGPLSSLLLWLPLSLLLWAGILWVAHEGYERVSGDHAMCGAPVGQQRVFIADNLPGATKADVQSAMLAWNNLFAYFYGVDIFIEHTGPWYTADVLVTPETGRTWVQARCKGWWWTQVRLGTDDAWRNAEVLPHELGHALNLGDHIQANTPTQGYINPRTCPDNYWGVMSYCVSQQDWFRCLPNFAPIDDCELAARYYP